MCINTGAGQVWKWVVRMAPFSLSIKGARIEESGSRANKKLQGVPLPWVLTVSWECDKSKGVFIIYGLGGGGSVFYTSPL